MQYIIEQSGGSITLYVENVRYRELKDTKGSLEVICALAKSLQEKDPGNITILPRGEKLPNVRG